jgi:hypothetical protein
MGTVMPGDNLQANVQTQVLRKLGKPVSIPDRPPGLQAQPMFPG